MWKNLRTHGLYILVILFLNTVILSDYFYQGNKPANFDAIAHITTIAQFHKAMSDGEFPVAWGDGFANYGLPLGTIAHQIPMYMGGLLTFVTHDPLMSFNIVYLISACISAVLFYVFISLFLSGEAALLATIFYSLAPYRILNLYMRGAMPEFFSALWVPLIFIAFHFIARTQRLVWYLIFSLSLYGLIMTHPMLLIIYAPIIGIWGLFCLSLNIKYWMKIAFAALLAIGLSAYYFLPLNLESKYLYHGLAESHYASNQTTSVASFFNPWWRYNCVERNDIFGRCHLVKAGVTETSIMLILLIVSMGIIFHKYIKWGRLKGLVHTTDSFLSRNPGTRSLLWFTLIGAGVSVLLSSIAFESLYKSIRILGNIQYPWRFLSAYLFFPPIALAIMYEYLRKWKWRNVLWGALVVFIILARFPQLYGKNYTHVPIADYYFTPLNLHSLVMNPIWTGDSVGYPIKRDKAEIVQGKGKIIKRELKNASRLYSIRADSEVTISDSTFYFPGWHVYVDGLDTSIEFQDPAFRGVITFKVPKGIHEVVVVYEDTKIRRLGKIISIISILLFATCFFYALYSNRKHNNRH